MSFEGDTKIVYIDGKPYWTKGHTEIIMSQEVLSKLKYYYDTPLFDTYYNCLCQYPLDVTKSVHDFYYFVHKSGIISKVDGISEEYKDISLKLQGINDSSEIDDLYAFKYLDEAPYFVDKLEPTNKSIIWLLWFLKDFWKKDLKDIPSISKGVSQNYDVQNKFVTNLQVHFDVNSKVIDTLLLRNTDVQYLCSLIAAGFLTPVDN